MTDSVDALRRDLDRHEKTIGDLMDTHSSLQANNAVVNKVLQGCEESIKACKDSIKSIEKFMERMAMSFEKMSSKLEMNIEKRLSAVEDTTKQIEDKLNAPFTVKSFFKQNWFACLAFMTILLITLFIVIPKELWPEIIHQAFQQADEYRQAPPAREININPSNSMQ